MDKLILLVRSYLHKSKGQMVSMLFIIIVAVVLMNIGALTLFDFGTFVEGKSRQLNSPHLMAIIEKNVYSPAHLDYLSSDLLVTQASAEDILVMPNCGFTYGGGKQAMSVVFQNIETERDFAPMSIIGGQEELTKDSVYAPLMLHVGGGYAVGDTIVLEYGNDQEYAFQISGFVEDMMFGATNMGVIGFYMPEPLFKKFMAEGPAELMVLLSAKLADPSYSDDVFNGFNSFCNENGGIMGGFSITMAIWARTMVTNIVSMMMVAFAVIITIAALIVIHFRISDTIRDDIKDIGILKAMGYTSSQIKASIMLQFLLITAAGSLIGIFISYLLLPLVSKMFSAQTGLIWKQGFSPATSTVCLLILLAAVTLNIYGSLWRVKNLHPVMAMREDTKTRGIRRNYFRLDRTKSGLQFALAGKLVMQNLKQNLIVALIIATVTYASAFGLVFYYNMAVDSKTFMGTIGGELCSVLAFPAADLNTVKLREEINNMQGVRKTIFLDGCVTLIGDEEYYANITEDFSELEGFMLYEGNYPKTSNETAIGGVAGKQLGKAIGDTIKIGVGNEEEEYIISGFIQSGNYVGKILNLTSEGVRRINPDYVPNQIYIYLEEGEPADVFIEQLESSYGSAINQTINMEELLEGQTRVYVTLTALLAIVVLIVTALIVILILYFVIKTMVVRRRRDFGVQKALGYTTFQLVEQVALSFLPVVSVGSIVGVVIAYFGINPMISALFRSIGIMRFDMVISFSWMVLLCAGIAFMSYVVAILISYRIRKISAYILITE